MIRGIKKQRVPSTEEEEDDSIPQIVPPPSECSSITTPPNRRLTPKSLSCALKALHCSSKGNRDEEASYHEDSVMMNIANSVEVKNDPEFGPRERPIEEASKSHPNDDLEEDSSQQLFTPFTNNNAQESLGESPSSRRTTTNKPPTRTVPEISNIDSVFDFNPKALASFPSGDDDAVERVIAEPKEKFIVEHSASKDSLDTPPASNVDPDKPIPSLPSNKVVKADQKVDDFCKKYFNTPKRVAQRSSLGDSITPVQSPENDDVDKEEVATIMKTPGMTTTTGDEGLQIPSMEQAMRSRSVPLAPPQMVEETIESDEPKEQQIASSSELEERRKITSAALKTLEPPRSTPRSSNYTSFNSSGFESVVTSDSSFSSVSSFSAAQKPRNSLVPSTTLARYRNGNNPVSPQPFFWRSHPAITSASYDPKATPMSGINGTREQDFVDITKRKLDLKILHRSDLYGSVSKVKDEHQADYYQRFHSDQHRENKPVGGDYGLTRASSSLVGALSSFRTRHMPGFLSRPTTTTTETHAL